MKKSIFPLFLYVSCLFFYGCYFGDLSMNKSNEITIYGNIIDRATGSPLYNAMIELCSKDYLEEERVLGSTVSGNDGNYEFTVLLNNDDVATTPTYYVRASKDKYTSSEKNLELKSVDKSNRVKVDFQLSKESIMYKGLVTDSKNNPIYDAHIFAQFSSSSGDGNDYNIGTTVMTDANGVYFLELPRPHVYNDNNKAAYDQWKYAITATKSGYMYTKHVLNQNVDDLGRTITLNFIMETEAEWDARENVTIYGKVTDKYGQPIANAEIQDYVYNSYYISSSTCWSTTQTNARGEYEIISPTEVYSNQSYTFHWYYCEATGYKTIYKSLKTSYGDKGKSYNFNFVMERN